MPYDHFEDRFPRVAYEADDHIKIVAPNSSILKHERFLISQLFGTNDERAYPLYALDKIGRIIRVFEVEGRIFLENENGPLGNSETCPRALAHEVYSSVRKKISDLYGSRLGVMGLIWLMNNLDSIQVVVSGDTVTETTFLMRDGSKKDADESNGESKQPISSSLN